MDSNDGSKLRRTLAAKLEDGMITQEEHDRMVSTAITGYDAAGPAAGGGGGGGGGGAAALSGHSAVNPLHSIHSQQPPQPPPPRYNPVINTPERLLFALDVGQAMARRSSSGKSRPPPFE